MIIITTLCETFLMGMDAALSSLKDTEWRETIQDMCVSNNSHFTYYTVVQYIKIKFLFYHTFLTVILIVIIIHSMSSKRSNYFSKTLRKSFSREDISDLSPNRIESSFILWSLYLIHSLIIKLLVSFWNLPLSVSLYSNTY